MMNFLLEYLAQRSKTSDLYALVTIASIWSAHDKLLENIIPRSQYFVTFVSIDGIVCVD